MPFTFAHPAIVLPLTKFSPRFVSLTGLVIGSLTPDFEYFIRMEIQSECSHTLEGVFYFDLPIGIILTFLFHQIVRNALIENLPIFFKSRFYSFKTFNWLIHFKSNWIVVIFSIIIGAFSHIVWDSFTHEHGFFVEVIPRLKFSLELFTFSFPIYKIFQHSSTFLGGFSILLAIYLLPQNGEIYSKINPNYWRTILELNFLFTAIYLTFNPEYQRIGSVIVSLISINLLSFCITSIIINKFKAKSMNDKK